MAAQIGWEKEYRKRKRAERIAAGLCASCKRQALPGKKLCAVHREKARLASMKCDKTEKRKSDKAANSRKFRSRMASSGLCIFGNSLVSGKSRCSDCLEKESLRHELKRNGKSQIGECVYCSRRAVVGGLVCDEHRKNRSHYNNEYIKKRISDGLCRVCGEIRGNENTVCDSCKVEKGRYSKERRMVFLEAGLCACGKYSFLSEVNHQCLRCYLRSSSVRHFGSVRFANELQMKFNEQNGRCGLTGIEITLGVNAELDHIMPLSRGGSKDISNTRWLFGPVNRMKQNMTDDELMTAVAAILSPILAIGKTPLNSGIEEAKSMPEFSYGGGL